jgi:hypothetical protein
MLEDVVETALLPTATYPQMKFFLATSLFLHFSETMLAQECKPTTSSIYDLVQICANVGANNTVHNHLFCFSVFLNCWHHHASSVSTVVI